MINIETAAIIAIVLLIALVIARRVGFKLDNSSLSLFASKKDNVTVQDINKSKVNIENRDGQDINVKNVSNDSDVKIK